MRKDFSFFICKMKGVEWYDKELLLELFCNWGALVRIVMKWLATGFKYNQERPVGQSVGARKWIQVLSKRKSVFNGNWEGQGIFISGDSIGPHCERKLTRYSWKERNGSFGFWGFFRFLTYRLWTLREAIDEPRRFLNALKLYTTY